MVKLQCLYACVCLGCTEESFSKHVDMIAVRGQMTELQQKLESSETQRKRARVEYEQELEHNKRDRQVP